jgi:L-alanine-DL-glutamate epimerase-like enolase superfamily enzyme
MKIASIKTIPLLGETPDTGWDHEPGPDSNLHTLIEVTTDEGVTGVGSSFTSQALVDGAIGVLGPMLIGEHALEPARVSEKLHQRTFWQGRGGAITHAISGIDIALWDITGKVLGQPVARLLGGCYRDRIKPYGSMLFRDPGPLRDVIGEVTANGFRAIKLGWGEFGRRNRKYDELLVRTARQAAGDDVEIMVDAGGSEADWPNGYKWALETSKMLADYDVAWFEEALCPDDLDGFVRLCEHAPVPIAGGEVLTRRQSFKPFLERRGFDIVQPDVTKVGGLTEMLRLGWMARDNGVLLVPHGWNTAVGVAADLALVAAMPVARWVEYIYGSPYVEGIMAEPFALDADGMLPIPTRPGLGIELDPDRIRHFTKP